MIIEYKYAISDLNIIGEFMFHVENLLFQSLDSIIFGFNLVLKRSNLVLKYEFGIFCVFQLSFK